MSGPVGNNPYRASGVVAAAAGGGGITWCTTAKTAAFCAAAGSGYLVNTCGGGITVTLPAAPTEGDIVEFVDLKGTWDNNAVTLCRNSSKIKGACCNVRLTGERQTTRLLYSGSCQGWVAELGINATDPALGSLAYTVQYLVVGGGGGTCSIYGGGGGGAGGYRTVCSKTFCVNLGTSYPIQVGAGGAGIAHNLGDACKGEPSIMSTITSAGGGRNRSPATPACAVSGGSGGGSNNGNPDGGGAGNSPPTPVAQGTDGGDGSYPGTYPYLGGGGGGANAAGANATGTTSAGAGGNGKTSCISAAPVTYAGGGGGGGAGPSGVGGTGGTGGGGSGRSGGTSPQQAGDNGDPNTGGGGAGLADYGTGAQPVGASGGPGIVVIRRLTSSSTSTSGTTSVSGCDTIHTFTGDGTFIG